MSILDDALDDALDNNTISNLVLKYIKDKGILGDGVNIPTNIQFMGILDEGLNKTEFNPSDIDSYYVYYSKFHSDEIYLIKGGCTYWEYVRCLQPGEKLKFLRLTDIYKFI